MVKRKVGTLVGTHGYIYSTLTGLKGDGVGGGVSSALTVPGDGDDGHHITLAAGHPLNQALGALADAGHHRAVVGRRGPVGVGPNHGDPGHHCSVIGTYVVHRHTTSGAGGCMAHDAECC